MTFLSKNHTEVIINHITSFASVCILHNKFYSLQEVTHLLSNSPALCLSTHPSCQTFSTCVSDTGSLAAPC